MGWAATLAPGAWKLAIFLLVAVFVRILIRARRSPLAQIPSASLLAPFSRLAWAFPKEHSGKVTLDLPRLHAQLGPLIRIAPNEVSFYSLEVYDMIHKVGSKFKKDPRVYGEFVQDGHPALFSITEPGEHSRRRRLMGQLFNRSKMDNLEGLMLQHISSFITAIKHTKRAFDLMPACRALEADIITTFSFGVTIGAVDSWSKGSHLGMVQANDEKATWFPVLTGFPNLCRMWDSLEDLTDSMFGYRTPYGRELHKFDEWSRSSWEKALAEEKGPSPFPNLVKTLVQSGLHPETALSEAKENLGPGTDTTSASLAHILWALAHSDQYQEELYHDLSSIGFATDMTSLESVAKLRACVKEGIRWAGAAAAMLPRIVPEGGVELCGKFVPEGTILVSSPIWYLRDKNAFPGPEEYDPYRWLTPDGSALREDGLRDQFYIPFSKGVNVCMGIHFSYYELCLSVSQLVRHFKIRRHEYAPYSYQTRGLSKSVGGWQRIELPERREWVAAVLKEELVVTMEPRVKDAGMPPPFGLEACV